RGVPVSAPAVARAAPAVARVLGSAGARRRADRGRARLRLGGGPGGRVGAAHPERRPCRRLAAGAAGPDPRDREPGHRPSARPRPRARFHDRVRGRAMKSATEDARRAMKRRSVIRTFTGLRVRVTLLLVAGMAFQAVGFQALITTLTRRWMLQ